MTTTTPQLALTRIVNAPRARVYEAFTNPDHFAAWWGPIGNSLPRDEIEFDVRPGGYQRWSEVFPAEPGTWMSIPAFSYTQSGVFVHLRSEAAWRPTLGRAEPSNSPPSVALGDFL